MGHEGSNLCPACGEPGEAERYGAQPGMGRAFNCLAVKCRVERFHEYPPEAGA